MRSDAIGLFWEDIPVAGGRNVLARAQPPIPDTGWQAPRDFPNLKHASYISLDTETYDPELLKFGPGWARHRGELVGASLAVDGAQWYFPMRHRIEPETNLNPDNVLRFLKDVLETPCPKIGANLIYDVGWLREEGIDVQGQLIDVQFAEALLEEAARVSVDDLGIKYLNQGKESSLLYQWCADYYGGQPNSEQRKNIYRAPPRLVGPYAEMDAIVPRKVIAKQYGRLQAEGLLDIFEMECGLIPLLVQMRFAGVRVDLNRAAEVRAVLARKIKEEKAKLKSIAGVEINVNSGARLAKLFDSAGLEYPLTAGGRPSFQKEFLMGLDHPIAQTVVQIRRMEKLVGTFIDSYIVDSNVDGVVYGSFHPLRGDGGGTRSGRFSSSTPNLQNIPSRDPELAPLIRSMYVPDKGHRQWRRYDYSQIEYRFLLHFAQGPQAEFARALFHSDPNTDYHEFVLDLVAPVAGWDVSTSAERKFRRKPLKTINFGLIFGMGVPKLIRTLGLSEKAGMELFHAYHEAVSYAKPLMDQMSEQAQNYGFVQTILGRRSRFDLYEPVRRRRDNKDALAFPKNQALAIYGPNIRRAYTHKALNRLLQGSAADLAKRALYKAFKDGLFDVIGVPRLLVHDEFDFSDQGHSEEVWRELQNILENAIPLRLPVRADPEVGPNWGDLHSLP